MVLQPQHLSSRSLIILHAPNPKPRPARTHSHAPPLHPRPAGTLQYSPRVGYVFPMSFQVPSNYPQVCTGFWDCLTNSRAIKSRLTVTVSGTPLQPLNAMNSLEFRPQNPMTSWVGAVPLQLARGMASFSTTRSVANPIMAPRSTYRVALLLTTNGWQNLKVNVRLEYSPN